ncbi:MAG: hypothetical protein UHS54_10230 [Lachnospiraceae bacterium]|nr:hypothetical protein [Lachnospiraceae bacterium]
MEKKCFLIGLCGGMKNGDMVLPGINCGAVNRRWLGKRKQDRLYC